MDVTQGPWPIIGGIAAAVGSVGGLAGVVAVVNAKSIRSKTYAEADQIKAAAESSEADAATKITDAALKLLQPVQTEVSELRGRVNTLETAARTQHMLLVEHSVWDHLALARMRDAGVELPPIPPLFPPAASSQETTVKVEVSQQATPDA